MGSVVRSLMGRLARAGLFLVLCAVTIAPVTACCNHTVEPSKLYVDQRSQAERDEDKSVAILSDKSGKPKCGGVWVSSNQVLTAGHCVASAGMPPGWTIFNEKVWDPLGYPVRIAMRSGEDDTMLVTKIDRDVDLALLTMAVGDSPLIHEVALLASGVIHDGDPVDVIGSMAGLSFTYSRCYVAHTREPDVSEDGDEKGFKTLQLTGPVWYGNSGGGAFDMSGQLIGIADYMRGSADGDVVPSLSFFQHRDVLAKILSQ